ncbi:MAG: hypothetical protein A2Y75_05280 [Candidatus Solincola sediminis]|uniref:Uncharacterized protein n=1 Tax=Candidatus Solincola sediminis TaxID=1797199 RepID=A0A1F2WG45_9ACTN|nr:MAG: hypothetical protein A2Y75_05280 [Candidatus Solincola sediminis]
MKRRMIKMTDLAPHGGCNWTGCRECFPETQSIEINEEKTMNENDQVTTALELRAFREALGLSRADVEDHTGLASSVVWRAEQPTRKVTPEQFAKILGFLTNVNTTGKQPCCGKKSGKKVKPQTLASFDEGFTNELKAQRDEARAALAQAKSDLHDALTGAQALVDQTVAQHDAWKADLLKFIDEQIITAKAKKQALAGLKAVELRVAS